MLAPLPRVATADTRGKVGGGHGLALDIMTPRHPAWPLLDHDQCLG